MEQQRKRNRLIALVVCLLMLGTLIVPMNVQKADAATTNLENPRIAADGTVTWDCVSFGRYPQSSYNPEDKPQKPNEKEVYTDTDGTEFVYVKSPANNMGNYFKIEPITWRVLSVNGDEALLLSDKNLDGGIKYNETYKDVTWESSTIRSWLNGYGSDQNQDRVDYNSDNFLDMAFTADEQKGIVEKTIKNEDNPSYKTIGGEETKDKVFFPSIEEMLNADYGFNVDIDEDTESRKAENTAYSASKNSYMSKEREPEWYWLRSPGETSSNASTINYNGRLYPNGGNVNVLSSACRFALSLDLTSDSWSYTGILASNGALFDENGIPKPVDSSAEALSYGSHLYKIFDLGNNSYSMAEEFCEKQGGHLATISSKEENDALYNYMRDCGYTSAYFGLTRDKENGWIWVNGEETIYLNWAGGESNNTNGHEDYGMFYWKFTNGEWNDGGFGNGCTDRDTTRFICEWDNTSSDNHENEKKFIEEHLEFIGEPGSGKYDVMVEHYNFPKAFLRDWSELKDDYEGWKALRLDFFDNPYDIAISNLILNTTDKLVQDESFEINLYSKQRNVIDSVIELMDGKNPLTGEQKGKFEKIFTTKDYSDEESVKLLNQILKNHISTEDLGNLFGVYDKSNAFMGLLENGQITVQAMVNIVDYITVLQMYQDTSDEFKYILIRMMYTATNEEPNPQLADAIESFLKIDNEEDVKKAILDKIGAELLNVGISIFKSSAENKVGNFIVGNMAGASASMASGIIAAIKIGYDVGTSISNVLVNSDETAKTYMETYAAAKVGENLRYALDEACATLREKKDLESAKIFCQAFQMMRSNQIDTLNKMISYTTANQTSVMQRIFKYNNSWFSESYELLVWKLNWDTAMCHVTKLNTKENIGKVNKTKCIVIACPTDVRVYNRNDEIVAKIEKNKKVTENGVSIAIRNNVKYIALPDNQEYEIEILATDNGNMDYIIYEYTSKAELERVVNCENIQLNEKDIFRGNIPLTSGTKEEYCLSLDGTTIDNDIHVNDKNDIIPISGIQIKEKAVKLYEGETIELHANISPANATIKSLTWYTEDPSIAEVDESGNIIAKKTGKTKVICSSLTNDCKAITEIEIIPKEEIKPEKPTVKDFQSIIVKSFTKIYGNKPFNLNAKAKTKLSYKSSNPRVATVSTIGRVTLKGLGKATITITAAATSQYNAATKRITITVKPKKTVGVKVKKGKKRMTVSWKRDKKATGYQITYAQNKKFKKGKKNITISKNKTVKRTIKKLKARKTYYVKVRAYKKVGKTKLYGAYSKVKKVKVR